MELQNWLQVNPYFYAGVRLRSNTISTPLRAATNSLSYLHGMAAYLNNRFVQDEEAVLPVSDLSLQRGYAVFDFFRTVHFQPLFLEDHLDRFFTSAAGLHLEIPYARTTLQEIIHQLIQRSQLADAGIRLLLTGGSAPDTYHPVAPNLVLTCNPITTATPKDFERGLRVITYAHLRELPHIKNINYLTAVWLQPLLKEQQADDVLYQYNGYLTEFPRSNVFVVTREQHLLTPAHLMLAGITRKKILELAEGLLPVEVRDISTSELMTAAEVFLTSTTRRILPVLQVDGVTIGTGTPGPITKTLLQRFLDLEERQVTKQEVS